MHGPKNKKFKHKSTNPIGFNKRSIFYIGSNENVY